MVLQRTNSSTAILLFALLITPWHLQPSVSLTTRSFGHLSRYSYRGRGSHQHYPDRRRRLCSNTAREYDCSYSSSSVIGTGTPWGRTHTVSLNSQTDGNDNGEIIRDAHYSANNDEQNRRSFLARSSVVLGTTFGLSANVANARGLIRFPCEELLLNKYHFLRAGTSLLEAEDIWSTNPLFLTNREAALSELGEAQIRTACQYLKSKSACAPTVARYSLAAASIDSANIVGEELQITRDRLVPEFNYMDPRAIGRWDFAVLNATEEAVWALDADEAGVYGKGGKPPSNEDGTPAETLADQVVRLTNLMSVCETLYSGDTILLVFPDGTGPALLSCLIGGIPLNRVHELQFCPGEIRCDVDYNSINALASQPPSQTYLNILERGRKELKQLRENPDLLRNVKDLKYEEEMEQAKKELEAKQKEEEKQKDLERLRIKEEEQEKRDLIARRKEEELKAKEFERLRKQEERMQLKKSSDQSPPDASSRGGSLGIAGAAVVGVAAALIALGGDGEHNELVVNEQDNAMDTDVGNESSFNTTATAQSDEVGTIVTREENATDADAKESTLNATVTVVNPVAIETDQIIANDGNNVTYTGVENNESPLDTETQENDPDIDEIYNMITKRADSLPNGVSQEMLQDEQDNKMSSNNDQMEVDDMDYDDAWLGAMSELMNDSDDENN